MTDLKQATWQHRNSDVDPEYCDWQSVNDYPHANILREGNNKSLKRINYTTIAAIIVAVLYGLSWLLFR